MSAHAHMPITVDSSMPGGPWSESQTEGVGKHIGNRTVHNLTHYLFIHGTCMTFHNIPKSAGLLVDEF